MEYKIVKEPFSIKLKEKLRQKPNDRLVFLCIGTDKVIGDSFGPCVGEELLKKTKNYPNIQVFGSLQRPVHYQNIEEVLKQIDQETSYTIAIDAALSDKRNLGRIVLEEKGLILGKRIAKAKRKNREPFHKRYCID